MNINVNSHGQEKNISLEEKKNYVSRYKNISMPARPMGQPCNNFAENLSSDNAM